MAVLFGLAMDYEVFLVASIQEDYAEHGDAQRAILAGARHAARVVTAAALIMIAVFVSFLPILLIGILFGLAMDYEVFLVSGMREEFVRTGNPDGAIRHGFTHAARVVTAAALIMFFVFFAFVPEGAGVIKVIALGLAVGIAIDAFLVRMTLVPAAMALAGKGAWWLPKWLDRLLPNVDIEGEGLREHREAQEWVEAQPTWAISSENLVLADGGAVADLVVERGTIVQLTGDVPFRRTLEATLAGRLTPGSGQLQVLGHPLPSESGTVLRSSTMIDTVSIERAGEGSRVGSLIAERVSLAQPWYRAGVTRNGVERAITRLNTALGAVGCSTLVLSDSDLSRLPALERAATLLTIALAERTALVIIDQADGFADENETRAFLSVVERLTPTTTTVIVGLPDAVDLPPSPHRSVQTLDLSTQEVAL